MPKKQKSQENERLKKLLEKHFMDFLAYYYCSPCDGCPEGHSSMWKTIIESPQWKKWRRVGQYDFSECDELGIMGKNHFQNFLKFVVADEKKRWLMEVLPEEKELSDAVGIDRLKFENRAKDNLAYGWNACLTEIKNLDKDKMERRKEFEFQKEQWKATAMSYGFTQEQAEFLFGEIFEIKSILGLK